MSAAMHLYDDEVLWWALYDKLTRILLTLKHSLAGRSVLCCARPHSCADADVVAMFSVRVNVTEEFPFLVTKSLP